MKRLIIEFILGLLIFIILVIIVHFVSEEISKSIKKSSDDIEPIPPPIPPEPIPPEPTSSMILKYSVNTGDTIYLPLTTIGALGVEINWGDGSVERYTSAQSGVISHTYSTSGFKIVFIDGQLLSYGNNNNQNVINSNTKLIEVLDFGDIGIQSLSRAFYNAYNLVLLPNTIPNTVTNTSYLLFGATNFNSDITQWNTTNITNMSFMFSGASSFDQNINTSLDGTKWNVSNVTNMYAMLACRNFNQNLDRWNVSKVTNMEAMFQLNTKFNGNISTWDVSNVTNMGGMFQGAISFNRDLSLWDVSRVTGMGGIFQNATSFDQNLGGWNISSVASMINMFRGSGLSTENYSNILIGWAAQAPNIKSNVTLGANGIKYNLSAVSARAVLTSAPYNWIIIDAGLT
jgi:surface protein